MVNSTPFKNSAAPAVAVLAAATVVVPAGLRPVSPRCCPGAAPVAVPVAALAPQSPLQHKEHTGLVRSHRGEDKHRQTDKTSKLEHNTTQHNKTQHVHPRLSFPLYFPHLWQPAPCVGLQQLPHHPVASPPALVASHPHRHRHPPPLAHPNPRRHLPGRHACRQCRRQHQQPAGHREHQRQRQHHPHRHRHRHHHHHQGNRGGWFRHVQRC